MQNSSSKLLDKAVGQFASLPGIGRKTALKFVLYLLKKSPEEVNSFVQSIEELKKNIQECRKCHNIADSDLCEICADPQRDTRTICVVENLKDILSIEATSQYNGLYHVLHGVLSPMNHVGPDDLYIRSLVERVAAGGIEEVIMATNPDTEGEATAIYLSRLLKPFQVKVTRLAYGIPVGSHLEYADDATLVRALEGRREI